MVYKGAIWSSVNSLTTKYLTYSRTEKKIRETKFKFENEFRIPIAFGGSDQW